VPHSAFRIPHFPLILVYMAEIRRVALVTGGAKRVGRAIVQALADAHFDVAYTYLSSEHDAHTLASGLSAKLAKALPIRADLSQPDAAEEVHRKFSSQFNRLDVLVNNASEFGEGKLDATDAAVVGRMMALHVTTPLLLCKLFAPVLRVSRGHVVNMLDVLAEKPWPDKLAYCASKAAMWNATLSLARELAPEVTVNGIAPGVIEWPADYPEAEREKYLKRVPLQRPGTPEDAAKLVKYLVTDGRYITGQVIRLDGGRSLT
jgi:pteridine reductase